VSHRQLWIFHVLGGETLRMNVKGNLPMHHDGDMSILRCLCTEEEAEGIKDEMERHGCRVKMNCPMETPEQNAERKNVMQVLGGDRPFPCLRCPECAWFDPHLDSLCGAGFAKGNGWDDDAVTGSMSNVKFQEDFKACPLREEQTQ